ncbi:hypothetical protein [Cryomorpha ignava]|nr:hypothetical protein [Cryomorpha ignava]
MERCRPFDGKEFVWTGLYLVGNFIDGLHPSLLNIALSGLQFT